MALNNSVVRFVFLENGGVPEGGYSIGTIYFNKETKEIIIKDDSDVTAFGVNPDIFDGFLKKAGDTATGRISFDDGINVNSQIYFPSSEDGSSIKAGLYFGDMDDGSPTITTSQTDLPPETQKDDTLDISSVYLNIDSKVAIDGTLTIPNANESGTLGNNQAAAWGQVKSYVSSELTNYFTIEDIEENYYTQNDIDSEFQSIRADITNIPKFKIAVRENLPTSWEEGLKSTIYVIDSKEYIYIGTATSGTLNPDDFELLGSFDVNITDYLTEEESNSRFLRKDQDDSTENKMSFNKGITVNAGSNFRDMFLTNGSKIYFSSTEGAVEAGLYFGDSEPGAPTITSSKVDQKDYYDTVLNITSNRIVMDGDISVPNATQDWQPNRRSQVLGLISSALDDYSTSTEIANTYYNKTYIDNNFPTKTHLSNNYVTTSTLQADYYSAAEIDTNMQNYYTKSQVDARIPKWEVL